MSTIKELKKGELFTLNSKSSELWVRGEYDHRLKKYYCYSWKNINHEKWLKGNTLVYNRICILGGWIKD